MPHLMTRMLQVTGQRLRPHSTSQCFEQRASEAKSELKRFAQRCGSSKKWTEALFSGMRLEHEMAARLWSMLHSFALKLPFVNISAICDFVLMYRRWIFSGLLTKSSNIQSRSTRWVRGTCAMAGERPLTNIFIVASLSSMIYKCDRSFCNCTVLGMKSTSSGDDGDCDGGGNGL